MPQNKQDSKSGALRPTFLCSTMQSARAQQRSPQGPSTGGQLGQTASEKAKAGTGLTAGLTLPPTLAPTDHQSQKLLGACATVRTHSGSGGEPINLGMIRRLKELLSSMSYVIYPTDVPCGRHAQGKPQKEQAQTLKPSSQLRQTCE